jgi:hypothetical protein
MLRSYFTLQVSLGTPTPHREFHQAGMSIRLAINFSTDWACVSHASDMLGVCIRIEATKPRTSGIMEAPDRFPNYGSHQVCAVIRLGRNEAVVGRQQVVVGGGR